MAFVCETVIIFFPIFLHVLYVRICEFACVYRHVYVCEFMWRPKADAENQPQPLALELSDTDQLIEVRWVSPVQNTALLSEYTLLMGNPGHGVGL